MKIVILKLVMFVEESLIRILINDILKFVRKYFLKRENNLVVKNSVVRVKRND